MIILGSADSGGATASFTLAKWLTSNTSTQYTIRICAFTANDRMLWTFRMICNNQNATRKIFPCKHTLITRVNFVSFLKNRFIFIFYSHSNFKHAQQKGA